MVNAADHSTKTSANGPKNLRGQLPPAQRHEKGAERLAQALQRHGVASRLARRLQVRLEAAVPVQLCPFKPSPAVRNKQSCGAKQKL